MPLKLADQGVQGLYIVVPVRWELVEDSQMQKGTPPWCEIPAKALAQHQRSPFGVIPEIFQTYHTLLAADGAIFRKALWDGCVQNQVSL